MNEIEEGIISYDHWNVIGNSLIVKLEREKKEFEEDEEDDESSLSFGNIDKFISKLTEDTRKNKEPSVSIYFNQSKARLFHGGREPAGFGFYDIKKLSISNYRLIDGKCKIETVSMNYRVNSTWEVEYKVGRFLNVRKKILDFDCYKLVVIEKKKINDSLSENIHVLFVTDKIKLPPHLICSWHDYVVDECVMEVKIWRKNRADTYSVFKVRNIQEGVPAKTFKVPKKYLTK